jgi:acetyl-CoA decarbonylase/synthase complex subunit gamma
MQIASGKMSIDQCPTASEEIINQLGVFSAPPLPEVVVGMGNSAVTLGGETVLYRHEKTFYHPTALAISLRDDIGEEKLLKRIEEIQELSFERVGQVLSLDMIAIEHCSDDTDSFVNAAATVWEAFKKPLLLFGSGAALEAGVKAVGATRPLLCPPPEDLETGISLASSNDLPLLLRAPGLEALNESLKKARAGGIRDVVVDPMASEIKDAVEASVAIRTLAISHRSRDLGYPTAFNLGGDFPSPFAAASLLIPKYGSLLVFDSTDPSDIFPLLTLRQDIFADPQQPIQVEPGLYAIGETTSTSPVLVTTNFSLTFFTVRSDVEAIKSPAYLLIDDCDGMSVLTAWAAETFSADSITKLINKTGIASKVEHRNIIIPGLVARLSGKIEELSGWEVLVGPQESSALPSYFRNLPDTVFQRSNG